MGLSCKADTRVRIAARDLWLADSLGEGLARLAWHLELGMATAPGSYRKRR
jgi:hypothetical protein